MAQIISKKNVKKEFFEIKAPLTSSRIALYASSMEELEGRVVLLDLTRTLRGKNAELRLKVVKNNDEMVAEPISLILAGSYIRRMMRKGTDYVEDSFVSDCKDGAVVVKPFMITRKRVSREVRKAIRKTSREFLEGYLRIRSGREIFTELMSNKIQRELSLKLKKVYPLALCEIRVFELIRNSDKNKNEISENKLEKKELIVNDPIKEETDKSEKKSKTRKKKEDSKE